MNKLFQIYWIHNKQEQTAPNGFPELTPNSNFLLFCSSSGYPAFSSYPVR